MQKIGDHIRQGDVLLVRRAKLPAAVAELPREDDAVVLAYGEVTGHRHQLRGPQVTYFRDTSGHEYVALSAPDRLLHEEHSTIEIPEGVAELGAQVEFEPAALRTVAD